MQKRDRSDINIQKIDQEGCRSTPFVGPVDMNTDVL